MTLVKNYKRPIKTKLQGKTRLTNVYPSLKLCEKTPLDLSQSKGI